MTPNPLSVLKELVEATTEFHEVVREFVTEQGREYTKRANRFIAALDAARAMASAPPQGVMTDEQIREEVFAVLRKWKDERAWDRYTRETGPYDVTVLRAELLEIIKAVLARAAQASSPVRAGDAEQPQQPFWYAVVSDEVPVINKAIKRADVAEEYAQNCRENGYQRVEVVPLYRRLAALEQPSPAQCEHLKGSCPQCHQCLLDQGATACPVCEPAVSPALAEKPGQEVLRDDGD